VKAGQTTLKRLIEGEKQYRVPLFQRPYTWEPTQLRQLWSDILDQYEILSAYEADSSGRPLKSSHFMGSFVLAPIPGLAHGVSSFLIVDGQQRLITLLVALTAIRDWQRGKDQRAVDRLDQLYLRNEHADGLDRYKILPSRLDRDAFFAFIDGISPPAINSKLEGAYRFFAAQLTKPRPDQDTEPLDHHRLERVIVERLAVVDITTEDDDNPHRIFESLNATGMSLTQADLLRNYLFMLLPTRGQEVYDKVWYPMEQSLGEDRLEGLARVDLQRRGIDATKDDVYRLQQLRLESFVHDEARIEAEIRDLAVRAKHYRRLVDPSAEPDPLTRAALTRLRRWGAETTYPLLMHVYDLIDRGKATQADMVECLRYIESFLVRRHLAQVPTNQLSRLLSDSIKQLPSDQSISEAIRWVLSGARRYWPTDEQIRTAARSQPFYLTGRPDQRKLILERIEEDFGHLEPVNFAAAKLTIEHIMPQTLSEQWINEIATTGDDPITTRDELVHTIGNLTLTAYNGVLSNNPFERKKQIYGDSNLELNKALVDSSEWGRKQILARAEELAQRITEIWPGPLPGAKGAPIGFDWSRIDAAVAAIPTGQWTTYGDLAILGGTSAQSVGNRMTTNPALGTAYRVLDSQGRIAAAFKWQDPTDVRDPFDVLSADGVVFGDDSTADPSQRLTAYQLALLIEYEFDPEELERLRVLYALKVTPAGPESDSPWLGDGKAWHLSRASATTKEILDALLTMIADVTADKQPNWNQKHYISWTDGSRIWMTAHPRKHWVWVALHRTPFTGETAATRLEWVNVPPGESLLKKNEGPSQVQASADGSTVWLQIRALGDLSGKTGAVLHALFAETWVANQPAFA
jgi:alkylated DNA nucleotide flippase Atl1